MMLDFIFQMWYLWVLVLLAAVFRIFKPSIKGWLGERAVSIYLEQLPKEEYTLLSDLILPTETGTTQIDHVVVSVYGVFVIEVKNYKGWIFGSEKSAQWTQNIYGKKKSFMNPIHQNYAHVKAIEARLTQYPNIPIIPIVAFSANCDLKVKTTSHVVYFHRICGVIRSYKDKILDSHDIAAITGILQSHKINSEAVKKDHIAMVESKKIEFDDLAAGSKCPKCSGTLVERKGKYGIFIGCSNYPKCRFTKQM